MGLNNNALDFYVELAKGLVPRHVGINKYGSNTDIDTLTDPETIWSSGGLYTFLSSAGTIAVVSDDANDDDGDTGARAILIEGLNANYDQISETVTLNGTDSVNTTTHTDWLRVNRAYVVSAGSSEKNEGIITMTVGGTTVATIPAEKGQTQMAIYTVPNGYNAYITNLSGAIIRGTGAATSADIQYYSRKNGVIRLQQEISLDSTGTSEFNKTYPIPLSFEEKTDLYAEALVGTNNTSVFVNFGIVIVDQNRKYQ